MVDVTEISAVIAAAGVVVGVVLTYVELRHQTKIRKTDLLVRLYSTLSSSEFMDAQWKIMNLQVKDYDDYVRQYGSMLSENPMHKALNVTASFYELLGILILRKRADAGEIYDVLGSNTPKLLYEKIKPVVQGLRKEFNEQYALAGFEYLCNELKRKEPQLRKTWEKTMNTYDETKKK
jgi:hypothetical protein